MSIRALFVLCLSAVLMPAEVFAAAILQPSAVFEITVGGEKKFSVPVKLEKNEDGKTYSGELQHTQEGLFAIGGTFDLDTDPFVDYTLSMTNITGSEISFVFTFTTAVFGGPYNELTSIHSSTLTDGQQNGAELAPPNGAPVHQPFIDFANTPVGAIGDGCTVQTPGGACDAGMGVFAIAPVSPATLGVQVSGTLSALDTYDATGRVELTAAPTAVPEPASLLLLGTAVGALAWRRRKPQTSRSAARDRG